MMRLTSLICRSAAALRRCSRCLPSLQNINENQPLRLYSSGLFPSSSSSANPRITFPFGHGDHMRTFTGGSIGSRRFYSEDRRPKRFSNHPTLQSFSLAASGLTRLCSDMLDKSKRFVKEMEKHWVKLDGRDQNRILLFCLSLVLFCRFLTI